jgi:hypothetical protein
MRSNPRRHCEQSFSAASVLGLHLLTFEDASVEIEKLSGEAVFLILVIMPRTVLRMKNHLTRLPIQNLEAVA